MERIEELEALLLGLKVNVRKLESDVSVLQLLSVQRKEFDALVELVELLQRERG